MRRSNCHLPVFRSISLPVALAEVEEPRSFGSGAKGIAAVIVTKKIPGTFCRNIINPLASRNADDP